MMMKKERKKGAATVTLFDKNLYKNPFDKLKTKRNSSKAIKRHGNCTMLRKSFSFFSLLISSEAPNANNSPNNENEKQMKHVRTTRITNEFVCF